MRSHKNRKFCLPNIIIWKVNKQIFDSHKHNVKLFKLFYLFILNNLISLYIIDAEFKNCIAFIC